MLARLVRGWQTGVGQCFAYEQIYNGPTLAANDVATINLWLAHVWAMNKLLPGKVTPGAKRRQFASASRADAPEFSSKTVGLVFFVQAKVHP